MTMNGLCALALCIAVVSFLAVIALWYIVVRHVEKVEWNGGYCKQTGRKWRWFDIASDGSWGCTDDCGNYLWINFPQYLESPKNEVQRK